MNAAILVDKLSKHFVRRQTFPGILGAIRGLFFAKQQQVAAIQEISFAIRAGERVAFIGPNGAGKSTTIKMLTGILYPSSGVVEVLEWFLGKIVKRLAIKLGLYLGKGVNFGLHYPLRTRSMCYPKSTK